MPRRRNRLSIMDQILSVAREGTLKTQIMYRANLSFAQLNKYLSFLQELRLLKLNSEDGRTTYKTTSKGIKYLENFSKIKDLLKKDIQQNPTTEYDGGEQLGGGSAKSPEEHLYSS